MGIRQLMGKQALAAVAALAMAVPVNAIGRNHSFFGGIWNYSEQLVYGWPWIFLDYSQHVKYVQPAFFAAGEYEATQAGELEFGFWSRDHYGFGTQLHVGRLLGNLLWWGGIGVCIACLVPSANHGAARARRWRFGLRTLFLLQTIVILGIGLRDGW